MKKKKLEAKLAKTRKKLAATKTELDAMMDIINSSGMPKASGKPAVGKTTAKKKKAPAKPKAAPAAKRPAPVKAKPRSAPKSKVV